MIDPVSLEWSLFRTTAERTDITEDGNRSLVQRFRTQLTQELDSLHKTVSTSVMQQEDHLKQMEDDMQSFVSSKDEAIQFSIYFVLKTLSCVTAVYIICLGYPIFRLHKG